MQGSSHNLDTLATLGVRKKALVVQKDYKEDVPLGADAGQASAHEEGIEEAVGHNEVQWLSGSKALSLWAHVNLVLLYYEASLSICWSRFCVKSKLPGKNGMVGEMLLGLSH